MVCAAGTIHLSYMMCKLVWLNPSAATSHCGTYCLRWNSNLFSCLRIAFQPRLEAYYMVSSVN